MSLKVEHISYLDDSNNKHPILQDICMEIPSGTCTLLVGQTGAGKSSLLDLLAGLRPCSSGTIRVDGQPLWTGKQINPLLAAQIGVVFQYPEHQLFARTVQGEFDYSLRPLRLDKSEASSRVEQAMRSVGLDDTLLSQPPLLLSGGQKRRVALASTFATTPQWLFLDEPTAGLDPESVGQLTAYLQTWKETTQGGLIIATHDLDALFPIADRVVVLDNGRVIADLSPEELCAQPDVLLQARVGLPSSTRLAQELAACGIRVPSHPLPPVEMAQAILAQLAPSFVVQSRYTNELLQANAKQNSTISAHSTSTHMEDSRTTVVLTQNLHANDQQANTSAIPALPASESAAPSLVQMLDPRTKWAFYLLVSIGMLQQYQWPGMLLSTLITIACVWMSHVSARYVWKVIRPFLFFIVISILLSGLRLADSAADWHVGAVGFAWSAAVATFFQVYKILLIMVVGILLPATTSQLRMKRGLEQALSGLARFKLPVEAFSLAASLMLRFVPVIMREMERFSRITRARGKSRAKVGRVQVRDITAIVIPLLLSVLQLGEDLSTAMEARGYLRMGQKRTASIQLRWQRKDWLTVGLGLILLLVLLVVK